MAYIPLDIAKRHLNIESDFQDDDEYILGLINMAEDTVEKHVNESWSTLAEKNGGCIPAALFQAALLLIGQMYNNREIVGTRTGAIPFGYQYLIDLYRNYEN